MSWPCIDIFEKEEFKVCEKYLRNKYDVIEDRDSEMYYIYLKNSPDTYRNIHETVHFKNGVTCYNQYQLDKYLENIHD